MIPDLHTILISILFDDDSRMPASRSGEAFSSCSVHRKGLHACKGTRCGMAAWTHCAERCLSAWQGQARALEFRRKTGNILMPLNPRSRGVYPDLGRTTCKGCHERVRQTGVLLPCSSSPSTRRHTLQPTPAHSNILRSHEPGSRRSHQRHSRPLLLPDQAVKTRSCMAYTVYAAGAPLAPQPPASGPKHHCHQG